MDFKTLRLGLVTSVVSMIFIFSGSAQQQGERERAKPPTFAQLLEDLDKNEDGKLSKKEIKGPLKAHFDEVDLNEDGFITEEEFEKAPKPERVERGRRGGNN
ncbi:MAG: EF-hand domain-containing protein [Bacteroidota bacterium]